MRARTHMLASLAFALALAAPFAAHAQVALLDYSVAPATIYPSATSSALATSTTISFGFSTKVKVSLKVLDAAGDSIKTLYTSSGVTNPAPKTWDGTDAGGSIVAPGLYTLSIAATSTATSTDALYDTSKQVEVALPPVEPPPDFSAQEYSLPLSAGWNLLSLPVMPDDLSAAHVFANPAVHVVWSYDPADPAAIGGWLVYDPAHPELSNLSSVAAGAGYFVEATASGALAGTGTPFLAPGRTPPSRALAAGWNLVGSYASSSEDIDSAFASIGWAGLDYTALFSLMPGTSSFGLPDSITPGGAYWIFTPAAATYAPSDL